MQDINFNNEEEEEVEPVELPPMDVETDTGGGLMSRRM